MEEEMSGEEIICAILYPENSDKSRFSNLKKLVENDYVLNKAEQPRVPNLQANRSYNECVGLYVCRSGLCDPQAYPL